MVTKQQILQALTDLPDETSIEEAMERLFVLYKVERGLAQAAAGNTVKRDEALERMKAWLS